LFRFYITQHANGYSRYYCHDLATPIYKRLRDLPAETSFGDVEVVKSILALDHPCEEMHEGKSYIFPDTITPLDYSDVIFSESAAYIMQNGEVVSSCTSSRENATAAEAWVFTQPDYRGRGYARQVTMAWGHRLQKQGKIPFYSHHRTNLASEAVARSLGLMKYIEDIGYM
jgi:RimJ/RimL family protein N-acetyltransferase